MTLSRFKELSHLSNKKSDWFGYSYMCIVERFRDDAEAGYENGDLTANQRAILIEQGVNMANRFSY